MARSRGITRNPSIGNLPKWDQERHFDLVVEDPIIAHEWVSYLMLTSAITGTCPWRDRCQERSDSASGMTRVGVRCIALFGFMCVYSEESFNLRGGH